MGRRWLAIGIFGLGCAAPESALLASPSAAGGEAAAEFSDACSAEALTLDEVHSGRVRSDVSVSVPGLVAASQKFLLSEASSGSCLWAVFAAGAGRSGAGSGLLLVSFGAPAGEDGCEPGGDGIPDEIDVGDVLDARGRLQAYAPSGCAETTAALQLRVDAACPLRLQGRAAPPAPAELDTALATRIAEGRDAELLRAWGAALVVLHDVSAVRDDSDGDAVFPYGVMKLEQTRLEVHSRLYYFDLREGGPRAAAKAPRFGYPARFAKVMGPILLDYCSWVLAPRDRCDDLSPASANCARLLD